MRLCLALALVTVGCAPTTAEISLALADGTPAADALAIHVFDAHRELKGGGTQKSPKLPRKLWLELPAQDQELRLAVVALANGAAVARGGLRFTTHAQKQVSASLVLSPGTPDGDADGIPDDVDNCPAVPNADQASASGQAGDACPGGGGPRVDLNLPATMQLTALHPDTAAAGATISVEGTFDAAAEVLFPGTSQAVAPDRRGSHRLQVTVPAGAGAGDLIVISGMGKSNAAFFRRAPFMLAPGQFSDDDAQIAVARATSKPADDHDRLVAIGDRLCAFGNRFSTSFECARRNADGTLGAFAPANGGFSPNATDGSGAVVIGNRLYVTGGFSFDGVQATVWTTSLGSDGTFDALAPTASLTMPRQGHATVVLGNYVYAIGGFAGGDMGDQPTGSIERATIAADGTLQAFMPFAGSKLGTPRAGFGIAVVGRSLYAFGGFDGNTQTQSVEVAPVGDDGELGAFSAALSPNGWPDGRADFVSAVIGNHVYVFGGARGGVNYATIESAQIDPASGQMLPFGAESPVVSEALTNGGTAAVVDNQVWLLGAKLHVASIGRAATLGSFAAAGGVSLTRPRSEVSVAVVGSRLFAFGGRDGTGAALDTVDEAPIAADGSLGAFVARPALARARAGAVVIATDAYVYLAGGGDTSVERIAIGSDGTLLSARELVSGVTLQRARAHASAFVAGGNVYVVGGLDPQSGAPLASVERAPLMTGGMLGSFALTATPPMTLSAARGAHVGALVGGSDATSSTLRYFVLGGTGASGALDTIESATLAPAAADFRSVSNLASPRATPAGLRVGDAVHVLGGGAASSELLRLVAPGMLGAPATGPMLPGVRRFGSAVVLRDFAWLIGAADANGPLATVDRAPLQP